MTPKNEALAFRIWQYCSPLGWDCTISEIAEHLDVFHGWVTLVMGQKHWLGRLRVQPSAKGFDRHSGMISSEALHAKHELIEDYHRDGIIR